MENQSPNQPRPSQDGRLCEGIIRDAHFADYLRHTVNVVGARQCHALFSWTKKQWGAFTNTDLKEYLDQKKVTQVVIVGVATSIGVESTARHAFELGFNVTIATDACTDLSQESHTHSLTRIFPRLGETGTTEEVISLLEKNSPLK